MKKGYCINILIALAAISLMFVCTGCNESKLMDVDIHDLYIDIGAKSREEAEKIVREYEAANPVIPAEPDRMYQVAKTNVEAWQKPPEPELITKQTIISFGPLVFLPFPFEMFSSFSLRIRKYSPFEYPLLCSIANGYYGYLPDRAAFAMGGYEVEWLCFARNYVVARNAGDMAVVQTLDALEK